MSSTPPPHTPAPLHFPASKGRVGHRLRPVVIAAIIGVVILIAAAVTVAIVLTGTTNQPKPLPPMLPSSQAAMAAPAESGISGQPDPPGKLARTPTTAQVILTAADPIDIGQGISITPAPGWTLENRGPNWVMLRNADSSAEIYAAVKPAGGTDVVTVLRADIDQLSDPSSGGLVNPVLFEPTTKTVQSAKFQQAAFIDYFADVLTEQGAITVSGAFSELLNTSNQQSAFIDFRRTADAPDQASGDAGTMIQSML